MFSIQVTKTNKYMKILIHLKPKLFITRVFFNCHSMSYSLVTQIQTGICIELLDFHFRNSSTRIYRPYTAPLQLLFYNCWFCDLGLRSKFGDIFCGAADLFKQQPNLARFKVSINLITKMSIRLLLNFLLVYYLTEK